MNYDLESDEKSSGFFSAGSVLPCREAANSLRLRADAEQCVFFSDPGGK